MVTQDFKPSNRPSIFLNLQIHMSLVTEFNDYRARMNERILATDNKVIKRFWSLDNQTYQATFLGYSHRIVKSGQLSSFDHFHCF